MNDLSNLPLAPSWSLAVGDLGRSAVYAGLCFFLLSAALWLRAGKQPALGRMGAWSFGLGTLCLFATLGVLGVLFVRDQFHYEYVFQRAAANTALHYKIAGIWAGQQGSFLLWACCSAIFGLAAMRGTGPYRRWFTVCYSVFLAAITGILAYETPFTLMRDELGRALAIPDGAGLTPSLQNYWVVIHPPTIFLGFGALTVPFAWAASAMLLRDPDGWVKGVRPWTLLATSILGLGLCMGGFWAYETLGWGGFWAWDPVENVSFVPWALSAVFLHGLIVQVSRGRWKAANLLWAGLPFLSFVYGTFLTRSGFLSEASVHSFAEMDRNALWILLGFMSAAVVFYVGLWLTRGRKLGGPPAEEPAGQRTLRRETMYYYGAIFLTAMALTTAIGMSLPFFMALFGKPSKVVEESLYHQVLGWFFLPLMLLIGIAPFVSWRGLGFKALLARLFGALFVSLGLVGWLAMLVKAPSMGLGLTGKEHAVLPFGVHLPLLGWVLLLAFVCVFAAVANLWRMIEVGRKAKMSVGGFLSHVGLAMLMAGLIVSRGLERKEEVLIKPDAPAQVLGRYAISYKRHTQEDIFNRDNKVLFDVFDLRNSSAEKGPEVFEARPGLYYFRGADGEQNPMVWPHIHRYLTHDLYFTLHPPILEVWPEPVRFKEGETKEEQGIKITYMRMTVDGEPGTPGAQFGALLKAEVEGQEFFSLPKLEVGERGVVPLLGDLNEDLAISMTGMDAADRSVQLQVIFKLPIYPVTFYNKPLTSLVWLGTGILTLGGLLSAFYRRRRKETSGETRPPVEREEESSDYAPVPTA